MKAVTIYLCQVPDYWPVLGHLSTSASARSSVLPRGMHALMPAACQSRQHRFRQVGQSCAAERQA